MRTTGRIVATTLALATGPADGSRSPFGAVREPGRYYLSLRTAGFPPGVDHEFVLEILDGAADAIKKVVPAEHHAKVDEVRENVDKNIGNA